MKYLVFSPEEFFFAIVLAGLVLLGCVYFPVQLAAKLRRMRALRTRIICRICGYRFLCSDTSATCPHCGAHNR